MPFNAVIIGETEKAIQLCHLPDNISSLGSCYAVFWLPKKTISRTELQNKQTNTGKDIHRIYYTAWSSDLVQRNYDSNKYDNLPKLTPNRNKLLSILAMEGDLVRDEIVAKTGIARTTAKNNLDVLIRAFLVYEYKKPRCNPGTPQVAYGLTDRGIDIAEDILFKGKSNYKVRSRIRQQRNKIKAGAE